MQETSTPLQETPSSISLREYTDILRRRRAIILQTFVIVLVIGILFNLYTPLTFRASARLLLAAPSFSINTVNSSDPLADLFQINQQYSLVTQVQLIQGPKVREAAVSALGAKNGLPAITVTPIENTQIIDVSAEGEDPTLVAGTPNALLKAYIDQVNSRSKEQLQKAVDYAATLRDNSRTALTKADADIKLFKKKNNIIEIDRNKLDQMTEVLSVENAYTAAESDLIGLHTRMAQTREKMIAIGRTRVPIPGPVNDLRLQQLDDQMFTLDLQRSTALRDYMPSSEVVKDIEKQKRHVQDRYKELFDTFDARNAIINPLWQSFADELERQSIDEKVLLDRIADLDKQREKSKTRLVEFPELEQEWAELQHAQKEADTNWNYWASRGDDLVLRLHASKPGPIILQEATVPTKPIRPNREQNILFAGLLGLFFGLCLALLQELFDDRINSPEEAERTLRIPSLGMIPMIEEEGLRLIRDTHLFSPLMESYRRLRTNINFAAVGNPVRSIVVTSSIPAEGKSTTVANLSMAMALDNKRVIIVDADLRRPSLHKLFKIDSSPGLTDVLVGTYSLDQAIRPTGTENVSVISAGSIPPNPAELLGSAAMGRLLADLEARADVILFDSPPILAVADSVVLASRTNGVLVVVAFGETKKVNTRTALEHLRRANANVLGTVLNRMEGQNSGYYYGKYYVPVTDKVKGSAASTEAPAATPALQEPEDKN